MPFFLYLMQCRSWVFVGVPVCSITNNSNELILLAAAVCKSTYHTSNEQQLSG